MFLGSKEIWHEKGKYSLIIVLITLITFLTFFLSSLANGLATSNKSSLLNLETSTKGIIIDKNANSNLLASKLDKDDDKDYLNISNAVLKFDGKQNNIILMNSNKNIIPKIIEGKKAKKDNEIVISNTVKNELNIKLNDKIKINKEHTYKIVGFTKDSQYQTQDVAYLSEDQYLDINPTAKFKVNGYLANNSKNLDDNQEYFTMDKLIESLPGYQPQVMTFGMMIGFLVVISATIVAIFIFILTIQKTDLFAVMKIRGYRSGFIGRSVLTQILIIVLLSNVLALAINVGLGSVLPKSMFFEINYQSMMDIALLMIVSSLIGGLFSIMKIKKINPTQALRG